MDYFYSKTRERRDEEVGILSEQGELNKLL